MVEALVAGHGAMHVEASVMPGDVELRDTIRRFASARRCPCTVVGQWQLEERFQTSRKALTQYLYRVGPLVYEGQADTAGSGSWSRL
mmetsp:Transcript_141991/g.395753  ORF Transcript_141991/g.395753 Transcript_141991/m.395753 type:complete len:87 (+) Transcript_141991:1-261(+)